MKTEQVAMIDETLAHQYWPNEGPIGQHIHFGADSPWRTIVGIVKHAKSSSLESHTTEGFYLAMAQAPHLAAALVVRTNSPYPAALGVHLFNPPPLLTSWLLLASTVLLASYFPARRAAKVYRMVALRYE